MAGAAGIEAGAGLYRLRNHHSGWHPGNTGWYRPVFRQLTAAILAFFRLTVPVMLLLVLLGTIYLYTDAAFSLSAMPPPLRTALFTIGDFVIPLAGFSIQLTSRRYGPSYALAQLLAGIGLFAALMLANPPAVHQWIADLPALSIRTAIAFAAAFVVANLAGIAFFEAARGPSWWTAPLIGALLNVLVFCAVFYPLALAGLDRDWATLAWSHVVVFSAESVLLLGPYWFLRAAIPPLSGLNGY